MKKRICLALLVLMLAAWTCAGALAQTVTAKTNGNTNVSFTEDYYGFCIDQSLSGAYVGDAFYVAADTTAAKSNDTGADISQKLKLLFTQYFDEIFVFEDGTYIIDSTKKDTSVPSFIYRHTDPTMTSHISGDAARWNREIGEYSGDPIPDEGYGIDRNGSRITFSFKVFEPQKDGQQTFFAYKLDVVQAPATQAYALTVADSENGAVESSHASAEENTTVTLTVKPAQGYALEELIVDSRNVTGEVADNAYSFLMPGHAVTVTAKFKHVCGGAETVPGAQAGCEDGWKEYHKCACGKLYEDAACQNEITDLEAWKAGDGKIEAVHAPGDYKYDDEKHWKECSCGLSKQDEDKHDFENELDEKCDTCGYVREIGQETFEVTVQTQGNGEADVDVDEAPENGEVRLTIKPADGHRLVRLTVNDQDVTDAVSNNVYTFKMPAGDVQISVLFEEIPANTFAVRFHANGGSGQMPEQTFAESEEQTLTRNAFTWNGYMFIGWNTEPDGSGEAIADGASIKPDKDMTLYAQWQAETPVNPLRIVKHPQDQYVTEGQKAEFSVEAEGDGLTYQWYVDRMDGNGLCVIEGATEKNYVTSVVNPGNDEYLYLCRVTDAHGSTMLSGAAVLHVCALPALPQTGDSSAPMLWLAMGVLSVLGMAILRKKAHAR